MLKYSKCAKRTSRLKSSSQDFQHRTSILTHNLLQNGIHLNKYVKMSNLQPQSESAEGKQTEKNVTFPFVFLLYNYTKRLKEMKKLLVCHTFPPVRCKLVQFLPGGHPGSVFAPLP